MYIKDWEGRGGLLLGVHEHLRGGCIFVAATQQNAELEKGRWRKSEEKKKGAWGDSEAGAKPASAAETKQAWLQRETLQGGTAEREKVVIP